MLRAARESADMSVSELAARSATSRSAIADYEAGRKNPRTDTAERLLNTLGTTFTTALLPRVPAGHRAVFDRDDVHKIVAHRASPAKMVWQMRELTPAVIESDCAVEHIALSWGEAKALAEGTTIGGDSLQIWRATQIARSIRATVKQASSGRTLHLRTVEDGTLIEANEQIPDVERELDYFIKAVGIGADPALTLHHVSGALLDRGYPWLYVPYQAVEDYRQALVVARRTGDGSRMVKIITSSILNREWAR